MSPKPQLSMSEADVRSFLETAEKATIATMGRDDLPHLATMYFALRGDEICMWTYRKSQKAKNLLRDDRMSFLAEGGEPYVDAKGVLVRGRARLVEDAAEIEAIARAIYEKNFRAAGGLDYEEGPQAEIRRQVLKRIGVVLPLDGVASWDHALAAR